MEFKQNEINKIYCGDSLEVLKIFPDDSIDCIITSPPYYGLRLYSNDKKEIRTKLYRNRTFASIYYNRRKKISRNNKTIKYNIK